MGITTKNGYKLKMWHAQAENTENIVMNRDILHIKCKYFEFS